LRTWLAGHHLDHLHAAGRIARVVDQGQPDLPLHLQRVAGTDTFTTSILGATARYDATTSHQWVRDPDGQLLAQRHRSATGALTRSYYLTDGLGSVAAVIDANGTVRNRYTYSPYGQTTQTCPTGSCIPNNWRFTGEYQDPQTGYYKIGERYYQPDLGRWTQRDPLQHRINPAQPPEVNPYSYVGCNPINYTDPTGLSNAVGKWIFIGAWELLVCAPLAVGTAVAPPVAVAIGFGCTMIGAALTELF
jgi:RHS repeat-associated protein